MGIAGTAVIYMILGTVVAVATVLRAATRPGRAHRVADFLAALFFWPIFAPLLLAPATPAAPHPEDAPRADRSEVDDRIEEAEAALLLSMGAVEGIAEDVLAPEIERVRGLSAALHGMAKRLTEMDRLLQTPELSRARAEALAADLEDRRVKSDDPRRDSIRARLRNIERLGAMRERLAEDLERALFKMEEMSSQMVVLNFAGRPEAEVLRMIKEIAASVEAVAEGLLEVA